MAEKKFYWLKLKNDFFSQPKIKKLRKIAGGDTYTIIYLKLQLLSLQKEGVLIFEGIEENFIEELSLTIDEDPENVKVTVLYLLQQGLIEEVDSETFLLPETIKNIGSETRQAEIMRRKRALDSNNVTPMLHSVTQSKSKSKSTELEQHAASSCTTSLQKSIDKFNLENEKEMDKALAQFDSFSQLIIDKIFEWCNSVAEYNQKAEQKNQIRKFTQTSLVTMLGKLEKLNDAEKLECISRALQNPQYGTIYAESRRATKSRKVYDSAEYTPEESAINLIEGQRINKESSARLRRVISE